TDDGLGRETVADGIAAGTLLAFFSERTGAFAGIATVGLDLPKSGHWASAAIIGFVLQFRGHWAAQRMLGPSSTSLMLAVPLTDHSSGARPTEPGAFAPIVPRRRGEGRRRTGSTMRLHCRRGGPRDGEYGRAAP